MFKRLAALAATAAVLPAHALSAGELAFTSFNADEHGWSLVTFVDIAAGTTVYFSDNEWNGSAFNNGESYHQWPSGASVVAAGTVVRFSKVNSSSHLAASVGTLSGVSVSRSSNCGIANTNETICVYEGASAAAPSTFLMTITTAASSPTAR
jgi:hypothetical protein